jgi:hypothetical protein
VISPDNLAQRGATGNGADATMQLAVQQARTCLQWSQWFEHGVLAGPSAMDVTKCWWAAWA